MKNEKNVIDATTANATTATKETAKGTQPAGETKTAQPTPSATAPKGQLFPTPTATQAEQVLKLTKKIAELEKQLRKEPQTIEERIAYYRKKEELTQRYENYLAQMKKLGELEKNILEKNEGLDDFENERDHYRLQIFAPSYRDEAVVTLKNPDLLKDVLMLLADRMLKKANELKKEINA